MSQEATQPQVITLDNTNSVQILLQFIEVAQKNGAYELPESDILKRSKDVLVNKAQDPEISLAKARELLIQGIVKGQKKGSFTLEDASILHKVCQFIAANLNAENPVANTPQIVNDDTNNIDLNSLSDPVPFSKPKVV